MDVIVCTGGGTGGHVYPGLAVIEELNRRWKGDVLWVGSSDGMERAIVEAAGLRFRGIPSGKLRRSFSPANVPDAFRVLAGLAASLRLFRKIRPALVFSKGGYVSVPPVVAAWLLGIPVVTHESDLDPGLATRLNAPFCRKILVPYEESLSHFPAKLSPKLRVTGNPVREAIRTGSPEKGLELLGFSGKKPILFVLGGSQGAREINVLARTALPKLLEFCDVVHQMGEGEFEPFEAEGYRAFPYLRAEFPHVLAASTAVVSRAGAGSLWEFTAAGKPALLVPLRGSGTRGDQVRNAELFERLGAARVLLDDPIAPDAFLEEVRTVLDPEIGREMRERIRAVGRDDAAEKIAELLLDEMKKE